MIILRQDEKANIHQVQADCASVLWDRFGIDAWQLTIRVCGEQDHAITIRQYPGNTGPIILDGKNFEVNYTKAENGAVDL